MNITGNLSVGIGKGIDLPVDLDKMPEASVRHALAIGFKNLLQDSHSDFTKDAHPENWKELSIGAANKKLDSLYAGELRAMGTRETDPVARAARDLAEVAVYAALKIKTVKGKDVVGDMDSLRKMAMAWGLASATDAEVKAVVKEAVKRRAALPATIEKAQARVAEEKAMAEAAKQTLEDLLA